MSEENKRKTSKRFKGFKHSEESKVLISKSKEKPILQYSKSGEFIKEWDSATQAGIELNINRSNIRTCCKGKLNFAYGFVWKNK